MGEDLRDSGPLAPQADAKPPLPPEAMGGRANRHRYGNPLEEVEAIMGRRPYKGMGTTPSKIEKDVEQIGEIAAMNAAARVRHSEAVESLIEGTRPPLSGPPVSPTDVYRLKRLRRGDAMLLAYKRSIWPVCEVYIKDMEECPDLSERNSLAATMLYAILYTDSWRYITKLLTQLQALFGHSTENSTKRIVREGSVEDRIKVITARVKTAYQQSSSAGLPEGEDRPDARAPT